MSKLEAMSRYVNMNLSFGQSLGKRSYPASGSDLEKFIQKDCISCQWLYYKDYPSILEILPYLFKKFNIDEVKCVTLSNLITLAWFALMCPETRDYIVTDADIQKFCGKSIDTDDILLKHVLYFNYRYPSLSEEYYCVANQLKEARLRDIFLSRTPDDWKRIYALRSLLNPDTNDDYTFDILNLYQTTQEIIYIHKYSFVDEKYAWASCKSGAQCKKSDIPMEFLIDNYEIPNEFMRYDYWIARPDFITYVESLKAKDSFVARHRKDMYDMRRPSSENMLT